MNDQLPQKAGQKRPIDHEHYEEENGGSTPKKQVDWEDGTRRMVTIQNVYSYFEKACRKKCARHNPERQYGI